MFSRSPCTTRCAVIARARRPAEQTFRLGLDDTGPLLQQGLLEEAAGNSDLRPSSISSSVVSPSPISRSAVWSSAARWMIRSRAARSIRPGDLPPCYSCGGALAA